MIQKYKTGNLTWVDLNCPTSDEIRQVVAEYEIHPMVARELTIPTLRQKVDLYEFLSLCLKRGMSRKIQHHFPRLILSCACFNNPRNPRHLWRGSGFIPPNFWKKFDQNSFALTARAPS